MNTKEMTGERISAFADGELADEQVEVVLAALRNPDSKSDWEIYHQIGDVLRSDDMACQLSTGFAARMAARLEAEPAIIAPVRDVVKTNDLQLAKNRMSEAGRHHQRRWAIPGMIAAAAMASVAFVATPQLMVAMKNAPTSDSVPMLASESKAAAARLAASVGPSSAVVTAVAPEGVVLRDARIDDYLLAHQRFSPSVYSTAQYARSATFANDPNK